MSNKKTPSSVRVDDALAYRVYRCARLLRRHFQLLGAAHGIDLSQEQWFILNRLVHEDGLAQVQLGDAVLDDRPNVTRLVASLQARNLVSRAADAADGRKQRVFITPSGRRVHDQFAALVPEARNTAMKGVNKEDLATAARVLSVLESNLSSR